MSEQQGGAPAGGQGGGDAGTGGGSAPAPWFSDTQKDYVTNKGWKAPTDAVDAYVNLEKLVGADRAGRTVVLPKDDNDAEGLKAFRAKLGVPESADGYQVPEAFKDDPLIGGFAQQAHALGISAKQFDAVLAWATGAADEQQKAAEAAAKADSEKQLNELRTKWGNDFDKNSEFARRFLRSSGVSDEQMQAIEGAIGTRAMLELFHGWGAKTSEAGFGGGAEGGGGSGFTTRASVQKQVNELRAARIANQISEKEFHERMAVLGPQLESAA